MHPALFKLLRLNLRGLGRRLVRGIKTPRGIVFSLMGIVMITLWIGPSLLMAFTNDRADPEIGRAFAPLVLLVFCVMTVLTSIGEKAIYFDPSDVDFLFAGPFTRRELLVYKLASGILGAVFFALFMSVFILRAATWWIAVYVGLFLSVLFVQFLSTAVVLIRQTVSQYSYTWVRKLVLGILIGLIALGLWQAMVAVGWRDVMQLLRRFRESWAGICLLAPFDVFGRTITAETLFPEFLGWASLALGMDLVLLFLVIRLDANYLEAAVAISEKVYTRMQRARRGGPAAVSINRRAVRLRLPHPPWLGGIGPIAWRQLTTAVRSSGSQIFLLIIIAVTAGPFLISMLGNHDDVLKAKGMVFVPVGFAAWLSLWFTMIVPFDFRSDLDRMEWLKMLPVRPVTIVLGQLAAPTLIFCVLEFLLFGGLAIFIREWRLVLFVSMLFVLPYNLLQFGIDNLIFLVFPTRMGRVSPGDFQAFGRQMLVFLLKVVAVFVSCGLAAGLGFLGFWLAGNSWIVLTVVSWIVLVLMALAILPYIAWAFERFDVSVDTPAC
ncbi:MAG: putative ABC exporter domain-containing protein [bacterium]